LAEFSSTRRSDTHLSKCVCISWIEIVRGLLRCVSKDADGVKVHDELLARVTCVASGFTIRVDLDD